MINPFSSRRAVPFNKFYGRTKIISELKNINNEWIQLIGIRKIGKSSLLKRLYFELGENKNCVPIIIDAQGVQTSEELGTELFDIISQNYRNFTFNQSIKFEDILSEWAKFCKSQNLFCILLVDEAEQLSILMQESGLNKLIKIMNQYSENLILIMAGSRALRSINLPPFEFSVKLIGRLSKDEASLIITQGNTLDVDSKIIDKIYKLSGGLPLFIQYICFNTFEFNNGNLNKLPKKLAFLQTDLKAILENEYQRLYEEEKQIIHFLDCQSPKNFQQIQVNTLINEETLHTLLDEMNKIGLIVEVPKGYLLSNIFWHSYVKSLHRKVNTPLNEKIQSKPKLLVASYAKEDRESVKFLESHLSALVSSNKINFWFDQETDGYKDWNDDILEKFENADGFIVFTSEYYVNHKIKKYIHEKEIPIILRKKQENNIPVYRLTVSEVQLTPDLFSFNQFRDGIPIPSNRTEQNRFLREFVTEVIEEKFLKL